MVPKPLVNSLDIPRCLGYDQIRTQNSHLCWFVSYCPWLSFTDDCYQPCDILLCPYSCWPRKCLGRLCAHLNHGDCVPHTLWTCDFPIKLLLLRRYSHRSLGDLWLSKCRRLLDLAHTVYCTICCSTDCSPGYFHIPAVTKMARFGGADRRGAQRSYQVPRGERCRFGTCGF
jgi:hypothetical protein